MLLLLQSVVRFSRCPFFYARLLQQQSHTRYESISLALLIVLIAVMMEFSVSQSVTT